MANKLNRVFLEKLGGSNVSQFIGDQGELFFDPTTGVLRVSDGITPGGIILGALGSTGYCGSFFDTTTQTNPVVSTARAMTLNKVTPQDGAISDGVQVIDGSKIKILHAGNYNIQFSAQVDKTDSGEDDIDIWLSVNGNNMDHTNTKLHVVGNSAKTVAAWNWVVSANANDYYQIMWSSDDTALRLYATGVQTNPSRPGIPSLIVTVTQV